MLVRRRAAAALFLAALGVAAPHARAQGGDPNECDAPGDAPNVIVGDLHQLQRYGKVGDITGFSVGTSSCNIGTCWLEWLTGNGNNRHPTIGQNMFRLENGRFEHIGQSWLKHGFYALSEELCENNCQGTNGDHLGVNCSDPYSSSLNGQQDRLGPKFEVNPSLGYHPHPVTNQAATGDAIFKRLQVHDADLDPALHPTARWFVEGQYVAQDDAEAGNHQDNGSYREVRVEVIGPGEFDIQFAGATQRMRSGILAWSDVDPTVVTAYVDDLSGGRFHLAAQATDLGGGRWAYEYAVQNTTSDRAAGTFAVPVGSSVQVTNPGFHDVAYHSGEPMDGTDWFVSETLRGEVSWATVPYSTNPWANALRWGTLYNFRFEANAPPVRTLVTLGLFKPGASGAPRRLVVELIGPDSCNGDGACDAGENCLACPGECGAGVPDVDGDGLGYCSDCNENDVRVWATPGEVRHVLGEKLGGGAVAFDWRDPEDPGTSSPEYEMIRATQPSDFTNAVCLRENPATGRTLVDPDAATAGPFLSYLARARSRCTVGVGTTGTDSFGVGRSTITCP